MRLLSAFLVALACGGCATVRPLSPVPEPPGALESASARAEARRVQLDLAASLLESGNPDAALSLIATVRADGGRGTDLDVLHGRALRKAGLVDAAETLLAAVVRRHPRRADAWNELGILALDRLEQEESVRRFARALRVEAHSAVYASNLGFALLADGRPAEAVLVLRRALDENAASPRVRANLALALVADHQDAEARRVLSAGTKPGDALLTLGAALELRGDRDLALLTYREALSLDPVHPGVASAIVRLESP